MKNTKHSFERLIVTILVLMAVPLVYARSSAATSRSTVNDSTEKKSSSKTNQTTKTNASSKTNATYKLSTQRIEKIKSCIDSYSNYDLNDKQIV